MIVLVLSLLMSLFSTPLAHEVAMAKYDLHLEGETILVTAEFDQHDLETAVRLESNGRMDEQLLIDYLASHVAIEVFEREIDLAVCSISNRGHHYFVEGEFPVQLGSAKEFWLINTSIVKAVPDHSNVYYLHLDEGVRGFRLHKDRQKTKVVL